MNSTSHIRDYTFKRICGQGYGTNEPLPALLLEAELALRLARLRLGYDRGHRRPAAAGARRRSATADARGGRRAYRRTAELTPDLRDRADTDRQHVMAVTARSTDSDARCARLRGGRRSRATQPPLRGTTVVGDRLMRHLVPESDPDCGQDPKPVSYTHLTLPTSDLV